MAFSYDRSTEQYVLLCEPETDRQRDLVLGMLQQANIPAFYRDNGAGNYVRIVTGGSVFGGRVYVPISCQAEAHRLWASVGRGEQPEFSVMEVTAAYEQYMRSHPADDGSPDSEASESGYRLFKIFLLGFGAVIAAALILLAAK